MDLYWIFSFLAGFLVLVGITIQAINYLFPWLKYDLRYLRVFIGTLNQIKDGRKRTPHYTFVDKLIDAAKKTPERIFIYFQDEKWSYKRLNQMSNQVARAMREDGIKPTETVALMMTSCPEFVGIWFGLAKAGVTAALINYNIRGKSLLHCLEISECKAVVISNNEDLVKALSDIEQDLKSKGITVYVLGDLEEDSTLVHRPLNPLLDVQSTEETYLDWREGVTVENIFAHLYTSGTTGYPKAVGVTHGNAIRMARILAYTEANNNDILYTALPLYHGVASMVGLLGCLNQGCSIVIRSKFSASNFWEDCRRYKVTVVQYIGETLRYVCAQPPHKQDKNHFVRSAIGAALRPKVWETFLERHGKHIKIVEFYGATEGNARLFNMDGHVGSVGALSPLIDKFIGIMKLVAYDQEKDKVIRDSDGRCILVPDGTPGLLIIKITKNTPFCGYHGNKEQTEKKILRNVFKDGDAYFNSGDLLKRESDYHLYFVDRVGDTFRWKGENVSTNEVTDVMSSAPGLQEVNVYGVQIPGNEGRAGMMTVVLRKNTELDCAAVYRHACAGLASYARPIFLRVKTEFELTGTFKQKKSTLVKEGFEPRNMGGDPIYYMDHTKKCYSPLTEKIADDILKNNLRV